MRTKQVIKRGIGDRVLKAISHPIRIEILRILSRRVASPNETARELGKSVSNVSYHFKDLREEGCIELVETQPRRGALEHFYRAKTPPLHDAKSWAKLSKASRDEITEITLRNAIGEAVRALNAGTFNARKDRHLSWMPLDLDEQGWQELIERQSEWLREIERIGADAAERIAEGEPRRRVVATMMGFEAPPDDGSAEKPA